MGHTWQNGSLFSQKGHTWKKSQTWENSSPLEKWVTLKNGLHSEKVAVGTMGHTSSILGKNWWYLEKIMWATLGKMAHFWEIVSHLEEKWVTIEWVSMGKKGSHILKNRLHLKSVSTGKKRIALGKNWDNWSYLKKIVTL